MSEAKKDKCVGENNPFYGKHPSEETRQKMREAKLGKENNYNARSVYCFELNKQWRTITDARNEIGTSHISEAINGKRNYAGKHPVTGEPLHWQYVEDMKLENKIT